MQKAQGGRWFWLIVVAITLLAGAWRAWRIETPSLDSDEVWQIHHQEIDLTKTWLRNESYPPLYHWLVDLTFAATNHDYAGRWFSLVCGALTIPLIGAFGRRLGGPAAGIAAAGLLAVSANHVYISQHGRPYAAYVLAVALLLATGRRLRDSDAWRDWALFLVSAWIAVATHYYAGIALMLVGLMLLAEKRGRALGRALTAAAILIVACLPLLSCLRADLVDEGEYHHHVEFDLEAYAMGYLWLFTGNTLGPSITELRMLTSIGQKREAILAMAPWALLVVAPVGVLLAAAWRKLKTWDRLWIAVLTLAPPLIIAAVSFMGSGFGNRYYVWVLLPLTAALGVGAASMRGRPLVAISTVALVAIGLGATLNRHLDPYYYEDDLHAVTALVERLDNEAAGPAVLTAPLYYGEAVLFSLPGDWPKLNASAHPGAEQDWDERLPQFARMAAPRKQAWLVTPWRPIGEPQRKAIDQLVERLDAELVQRVSSTVLVYRFRTDAL